MTKIASIIGNLQGRLRDILPPSKRQLGRIDNQLEQIVKLHPPKLYIPNSEEELYQSEEFSFRNRGKDHRAYSGWGRYGYVDNFVPINGKRVEETLEENAENGRKEPIILDVGCGNGRALKDIAVNAYAKGIAIKPVGINIDRGEYILHPPGNGRFETRDGFDVFVSAENPAVTIWLAERDMKNLKDFPVSPDVIMSMAAVKYSRDPWDVFAQLVRMLKSNGYAFIAHMDVLHSNIYDINNNQVVPRQFFDTLTKINPRYTFICNEDEQRRVRWVDGSLVRNDWNFYGGGEKSRELDNYISELEIKARSNPEMAPDLRAKVAEVSGNGFLSVSVEKGEKEPFFGLLYAGSPYNNHDLRYLFIPDPRTFDIMQKQYGYKPV